MIRNKFCGVVAAAMLGTSPAAMAGPYDGAWLCYQNWAGGGTSWVAAVVTRASDNMTAFGIVSTYQYQEEWGYGMGRISGNVFSGTDHRGKPFSMTLNNNTASGTAQVWTGTQFLSSTLNCSRIW